MTWFANEILVPGSAAVATHIAANPVLAPFAYWVKDLAPHLVEHPWYRADPARIAATRVDRHSSCFANYD
jgi:hypothetical protein